MTNESAGAGAPSHHGPDGRFRNPWPGEDAGRKPFRDLLRWQMERLRNGRPPTPPQSAFNVATPDIPASLSQGDRARLTWIGHSSFLLQLPSHNILLDPVWSDRVSPFRGIGPRRITPPALPFAQLPRIDTVLLSHDHSDHLDEPTVRMLHARHGDALTWVTPLGYRAWFAERRVTNIVELDWGQSTTVAPGNGEDGVSITALPARHWTQRTMDDAFTRLWCSFALQAHDGTRIYFGGDSGYGRLYRDIAAMQQPFDVVMLPIGAYDPRWFMQSAHMNPEDAVKAYVDLGSTGTFVPMHWASFRLADDPPLEPPLRLRAAWQTARLPAENLRIPALGETLLL